ncbi:pyridoxamine 5'-phosphate oxidase [Malaciobacter molluscorum LMG 25693]|uniref:Pyridoxamine 5'-phosphate oxidase n=1 Tax=Malaciobacter molluscorum LMG 25693 TaxID=870501 RepID=A0A2G1DL84_9BACT|nr:pyridoxamine 5'-phosphate oxidase [Malaciobacter molluscorum]AXX92664.1 pyridoxine 5'-phosphate oxidase / pyridoxamine 5'-phosphate oxidase [Malaciobacter molluscorum LMG 25693]PHO19086.1 pyridoxamine 5'-phosphate oxidase [Malaciobacter molluscorum LMG 25693]RXJ97392.1 pyridoxamine 5'-phosphate oxidase [Malaciobacter molluscorum]
MDLSSMREEYVNNGLRRKDLDANPIKQFEIWFSQAINADLIEPNAMSLATVGKDMMPSIRTVLLKFFDESGFVFFSNYESEKAKQIEENEKVALHFAWLGLERQVKIEGSASKISSTKSLKYFLSRPKGSQMGAWVSHQSEVISSRSVLEAKFNEIKNKFVKGEIPFPSFWGGYIIKPEKIEFWQGAKNRLHDRFQYTLVDNSWKIDRLAP